MSSGWVSVESLIKADRDEETEDFARIAPRALNCPVPGCHYDVLHRGPHYQERVEAQQRRHKPKPAPPPAPPPEPEPDTLDSLTQRIRQLLDLD